MKTKMIILAVLAVVVLGMFGCVPGSEQWNILRAARTCVKENGLREDETLVFVNGIQRKCEVEWQDEPCKYAAVKYTVRTAEGRKQQRLVHLLMTGHCGKTLACSFDGKAEWVRANGLLIINW